MTVGELIRRLQAFDPDENVGVYDNGPGDGANEILDVRLTTESLREIGRSGEYERLRYVLIDMDGHA